MGKLKDGSIRTDGSTLDYGRDCPAMAKLTRLTWIILALKESSVGDPSFKLNRTEQHPKLTTRR